MEEETERTKNKQSSEPGKFLGRAWNEHRVILRLGREGMPLEGGGAILNNLFNETNFSRTMGRGGRGFAPPPPGAASSSSATTKSYTLLAYSPYYMH